MAANIAIRRATPEDVHAVAVMVGELLNEIMDAIGVPAFNFDLDETAGRLADFLVREDYFVFVACADHPTAIGFAALYEGHALYAEGAFGTIAELYVRPDHRGTQVGRRFVAAARALGAARGWRRLEVTTPPLPQFDRTLEFYERNGFALSGGRKLKVNL